MADIDFNNYPVSKVFPSLKESWQGRRSFILQADPGAGKSTMVPLYLLREKMVKGRIIVLEPRRMAARSLARYMSSLLGVPVGKTVGYRVRGRCEYIILGLHRTCNRGSLYQNDSGRSLSGGC